MKPIYRFFQRLYDKKVDASGLAVFRVAFSLVLLCEVLQLFYFRHLVFDKIPFLIPAEIEFGVPLLAWMVCIVFLIFGLFTRPAALLNYLFCLTFIGTIKSFEYHMFYAYMGLSFMLIFLDSSRVGSLDALRKKLKYSNTRYTFKPNRRVSVLNYYLPLLVGIGFVYFDSVFFKSISHNWTTGIGMWLPASLPQVTHSSLSFILDQKWLALAGGYITLVFETVFLFTFFLKAWRIPLLITGLLLHIGIVAVFPIP